ncbi:MAG: nucleotidyl transferase AbiEii/AbiGii toxin family protein [Gemmataceae bacterium]|nr:nucleotidyl transferase AbiEii/AbiGii toxin family protein [Gemmataceae bacterium]MCI0741684.1 nucleotidyl transferase AbiEii/AbiGii toxin family protein [Gemmataceae bacterium]
MPLTSFQKVVLQILAKNRNPESHAGGGAVINRAPDSPRFSSDLDFFHDVAEGVRFSAVADARALADQGFVITWLIEEQFLRRAQIVRGAEAIRLDWCFDSAYRFFPVLPDPEFGYSLHPADLATNKALAVAGRAEIRDLLDILYLNENYLSLGAIAWAACGKDRGFTPLSLLGFANRNMKFREEDLKRENLAKPTTLVQLKESWLKSLALAEQTVAAWPANDLGCLYLNDQGVPFTPNPADPGFDKFTRHFGSVHGAWPKIVS